jgi:hypothetical protein
MSSDDFADILFNTSTLMIIESPKDFLESFDISFFEDKKLISKIVSQLRKPSAIRIGEKSAIGRSLGCG